MPRYVPSELAKLKLKRRRTSLFSDRGHLYKCVGFSFMYRVNILDLSKVSAMRIILHCFFLQTLKFVWISFQYIGIIHAFWFYLKNIENVEVPAPLVCLAWLMKVVSRRSGFLFLQILSNFHFFDGPAVFWEFRKPAHIRLINLLIK